MLCGVTSEPTAPLSPTAAPPTAAGHALVRYLAGLSAGRYILWCYFTYWFVVVAWYFDPSPRLWLTSLGISAIVGFALYVSTSRAGRTPVAIGRWPTFRLFVMPFCVSSFSALVRPHGFALIFSPTWPDVGWQVGATVAACAALAGAVRIAKSGTAVVDDAV